MISEQRSHEKRCYTQSVDIGNLIDDDSGRFILTALTLTGLPLAKMLCYPPIQKAILINRCRKREKQHLIQP